MGGYRKERIKGDERCQHIFHVLYVCSLDGGSFLDFCLLAAMVSAEVQNEFSHLRNVPRGTTIAFKAAWGGHGHVGAPAELAWPWLNAWAYVCCRGGDPVPVAYLCPAGKPAGHLVGEIMGRRRSRRRRITGCGSAVSSAVRQLRLSP